MNKSQHISQLDVQGQLDWIKEQFSSDEFIMNILRNPVVSEIDGYLGAGCVYQRIWNRLTDRDIDYGIDDYDIVYFDQDLSKDKENEITNKLRVEFPNLDIDCVNEARVHLWYEEDYGVEIEPLKSIEDGIDKWPTTSGSMAIYLKNDVLKIYMPRGFGDLLSLTIRANKGMITREVYETKAAKWKKKWPELTVRSW